MHSTWWTLRLPRMSSPDPVSRKALLVVWECVVTPLEDSVHLVINLDNAPDNLPVPARLHLYLRDAKVQDQEGPELRG